MLAWGYSNQGGRKYNEDSCLLIEHHQGVCAVLADGLGGHGGGKEASLAAVSAVKECVEEREVFAELTEQEVRQWFVSANDRVVKLQTKECQMKTTLAVLYIDEVRHTVILAHIGDSRIYHFINGKFVTCTFDHSVSRMAVLAGEITLDEIRFHPDRNKLLKAIGQQDGTKAETEKLILDNTLRHTFLLCSDGFWEYVTEEEMEQDLNSSATPKEWIERMRVRLNKKVQPEYDNNSAIAVFTGGLNG